MQRWLACYRADGLAGLSRAARTDRGRSASLRRCFQLSYWDAAIIEAARTLGCTHVLSEDLSDGQDYGGVQVTNPFR